MTTNTLNVHFHNIDSVNQNASVFQGQSSSMTHSSGSQRGRRSAADNHRRAIEADGASLSLPTPHTLNWLTQVVVVDQTSPSPVEPQTDDHYASALAQLTQMLRGCEEEAVTSQAGHSRPEPDHYGDNEHDFIVGELYRIWQPTNTQVHLSTFLILTITGTCMKCLKIIHRPPEEVDDRFQGWHAKIRIKKESKSSQLPSTKSWHPKQAVEQEREDAGDLDACPVISAASQEFKDDCWIVLRGSWNIDWRHGYRFVYCGKLEKKDFADIKDIYQELNTSPPG
jgi:hypothetical protein